MRDLLTDRETAKILGRSTSSLYRTVSYFDKYDDDEWELEEGEHFEFATRSSEPSLRQRRFTEEGVEALARFYEKDKTGFLAVVMEALTHRRRRRKQMLVSRRITQEFIESDSTIEIRGELAFVDKKTTISILQTNGKGFNNSKGRLFGAGSLIGQEGLEIDKHFVLTEKNQRLWSQKGLASIAIDMGQNSSLTKSRKAWVEAVGEVVDDCFKTEINRIQAAPNRIERAVKGAKKAAHFRCQVTGRRMTRSNNLPLDGHHLFDKSTRPDLADLHDNILIVEGNVHTDFHSWNGSACCLPKHFLDYLSEVRLDLVDPANAAAARRYYKLVARLTKLQNNYEGSRLRYK
tara:strand:- start:211 stop:1251 length:1041 start_codon:yes stop_codon:yes gene_type:complete